MPDLIDTTGDFPNLRVCACCPDEDAEDCMTVFMGAWVCLSCKDALEQDFAEHSAVVNEFRYGYE